MRNFGKKWFISASSGIFGKILLIIFGFGVGIVGSQFFSGSIDSDIIKVVMGVAAFVIGLVAILFSVMICVEFPQLLEWFAYRRASSAGATDAPAVDPLSFRQTHRACLIFCELNEEVRMFSYGRYVLV